jgi:hypothetical protein
MALLNSKSPWRSPGDRATVVPLRSHQRPLGRQPHSRMKKPARQRAFTASSGKLSRQFVKSYG